ncbi:hypothetical protein IGI65_001668 [Enterococcus sp. DIV0755b]|uniref:phage tail spike protein n=1 Tax=Enterococcus sp. DIV0755b TaxID=2774657 RepID=UPI003F216009
MKIYVMTKADETVAILDNSLSSAIHYFDDEFHRYLETGASTFDLSIAKKHMMYSNASTGSEDDFQYLKENHFLVFTYKNRDYKFTIRRVEETESSLRLFCEDLSFDLLNEYRGPYKADKAYPISKYVNDCLIDSGYEIGINEFTKNERTLEWEGDQTVLKRLLSICNSFEAEIEFETILNDDRTVDKQLVHLRKRVGMDHPDVELKYGRDVSSIRRNVDVTELITAIKPRGHEEDGKVTTIANVEKEIKDENGNVVFYTKKGSEYIYAPMANQEYGNPKRKGGGYIVGQFSYDTKSDTELFNRALTELEKKCVPAYEFEIEGFYDIDIGDTIRAIDEGYNPILLLEARISEQTISFSDPTKNKTVYSNYRILENKVSKSLLDRIDEVKKYAEQVAKTYIFSINNVGSPMFKNGEGEVIFTAKIEKNNQDTTGEFTEFNWTKQKKDGSLDTAWNEAHKNFGKALTVKPEDFEDTATFSYEALQDDLIYGGASGVVTKVYDGENGKTPIKGVDYFDGKPGTNGLSAYLHVRYSQNANGNPMTSDPTNAVYLGLLVSQNPTASTVPADYDWSMVKGPQGIPGETVNGKTSYLHIKYSNDGGKTFTGNSGEDAGSYLGQYVDFESASSTDVNDYAWSLIKGDTGETGVSVASVTEEYYVSTSDTEQTGGEWSTTVPNNANPNLYVWRRVKNTMSDGTVSYTTPALIQGMTGIYPYIGPTQPANPKEEQQWWKSDSSGNITNFYVYKSGSWQGQTIQQSVLNIIALNAVTITGSTITGTDMYGSNFITTFTDVPVPFAGTSKMSGSATLSNGELTIAGTVDNTFPFMTRYTGTGYTLTTYTDSSKTTIRNILAANYDNIVMRDNTKNFGGIIQASMLSNTPWINLNLRTGYAIAENNRPQYRVTYNLDGTQHLSFRGQFKKSDNSKMVAGSDQHPFDVPSSLAPATTIMSYGGASTGTGSRPYVTSSGYFGTIIGSSATDYVDISMVTYDI